MTMAVTSGSEVISWRSSPDRYTTGGRSGGASEWVRSPRSWRSPRWRRSSTRRRTTTRELGGTLGVAIIGSVFSSAYIGALDRADGPFAQLPPDAQELTKDSVGSARTVADNLGP